MDISENGYNHFAILVENANAIMERVCDYGCKILKDRWFAWSNGTVIELIPVGKELEQ